MYHSAVAVAVSTNPTCGVTFTTMGTCADRLGVGTGDVTPGSALAPSHPAENTEAAGASSAKNRVESLFTREPLEMIAHQLERRSPRANAAGLPFRKALRLLERMRVGAL